MSVTRFDEIKALAFDHYGTLFDKHAISELIEAEFPGHAHTPRMLPARSGFSARLLRKCLPVREGQIVIHPAVEPYQRFHRWRIEGPPASTHRDA